MKNQIENYDATLSAVPCLLEIYGSSGTGMLYKQTQQHNQSNQECLSGWFYQKYRHLTYAVSYLGVLV